MYGKTSTCHPPEPNRLWPLAFQDPQLESEFRRSYWAGGLPYARFAMLSAAVLGAAFGILDLLVAEYALSDLVLIRFGFMVPIILVGFALSFVPYFKDRYHLVVMVTAVVVGGSITVMIAIIQPPASDYYYAGLIMVLIFTYTFLQLRLLHAVISGLCIFISYEFVAVFVHQSPSEVIINNTIFLISANYGGMFACYTTERIRRKNFWQLNALEEERERSERAAIQLEHMSTRDDLTGLLNRRQMEWTFRDLIVNFEGNGRPVAFIALDLDSFKIINDSNGHVAGDSVLKTISELMTECSSSDDLVYRYGGDEFVIILPGESALSALGTARRIAASIRRWAESSTIPEAESLGASIGITEVNSSEDTLKMLMTYADEALYRAKKLGKGRIVVIPRHRSTGPEGSADERGQN